MAFIQNKIPKSINPFLNFKKGFRPHVRVDKLFFDRAKVIKMIGIRNAKAMSRAGAFIRRRSQSLLRRRKRASRPGEPPSVHAPAGEKFKTLKNIHFEYDKYYERLVVGPHKISTKSNQDVIAAGKTVPQILEFGGSVTVREEKPQDTANVQFDWRKEGVYNNPARRANPKKRRKFANGRRRRPKSRWKPMKKYNPNAPLLKRVRRAAVAKRPFMAVALRMEIAAGVVKKSWGSSVVGG